MSGKEPLPASACSSEPLTTQEQHASFLAVRRKELKLQTHLGLQEKAGNGGFKEAVVRPSTLQEESYQPEPVLGETYTPRPGTKGQDVAARRLGKVENRR